MKYIFYLSVIILFTKCAQPPNYDWQYKEIIALDSISPVGLAVTLDGFWIADSDNNRVVRTDFEGKVLEVFDSLERPMHLSFFNNALYIPEYSSDTIHILKENKRSFLPLPDQPDAPASVDVFSGGFAVADFYNNRIIFQKNGQNKTFGKKGNKLGELNYPTDVQWFEGKIYLADAYNHRVQVFDESGKALQIIGESEKMNAATGIFINKKMILVTDFENNRVLTYTHEGVLQNIITAHLNKPADICIANDKLYVANYKGKSIAIFDL